METKLCDCGCGSPVSIATRNTKKTGQIKGNPVRFIHGHNGRTLGLREKNANWRGGKIKNVGGYSLTYNPEHPKAQSHGYVFSHRLDAEMVLGKILPEKAVIHHHTHSELVICENPTYHQLLHQRTRAYRVCGKASWRKCYVCKIYDDPNNLAIYKSGSVHPWCASESSKRRYYEKCEIKNQKEAHHVHNNAGNS